MEFSLFFSIFFTKFKEFFSYKILILFFSFISLSACNILGESGVKNGSANNFSPGVLVTNTNNNTNTPLQISLVTPSATPGSNSEPTFRASGGAISSGIVVSLHTDSLCNTSIGSAVATTSSIDIQTSALAEGAYLIYLKVGASCEAGVNAAYVLDLTPPAAATGLNWAESSPTGVISNNATWTKSNAIDLASQSIQFYSDGTCTTPSGSSVNLSNALQTKNFVGANGSTYTYKIISTDTAGNSLSSACSSALTIDTSTPSLSISTPSLSLASSTSTINYTVTYSNTDNITLADTDIAFNTSGGTSCSKAVTTTGALVRNVALTNCSGNGTLGISIAAATGSRVNGFTTAAAGPSATFSIDTTAPTAPLAAGLGWSETSPHHTSSLNASWTMSVSSDVASQSIQFYTGAACGVTTGAPITLSNSAQTRAFTATTGTTYTYKITTVDNVGNSSVSACSDSIAVDTTPVLTTITALATATEDTDFSISYAALAAAADEAYGDGTTLSFRVEAVSTGVLKKNSVLVTPTSTLLSTGETFVWTPAANQNGTLNAFTVKAYDGTTASSSAIQVEVTTNAVNDAPTVTRNNTLTLKAGTTATVTAAGYLAIADIDNTATQTTFTVGSAPTYGALKKSGTTLSATDTFTQDDIDNNRITYVHASSTDATLDSFTFTVSDGAGGSIGSTTFNITPIVAPQTLTRVLPASTPGAGASVTVKAIGGSVVSGRTVKFYTDSACTGTQFGADATVNGSNEASVNDSLVSDGAYSFYATVTLNSVVSACSPVAGVANYVLDTDNPDMPTGLTLNSPATSPNNDTTPEIRLSGGDAGAIGVTAKLYTNNNCATLAGTGALSSADVTIDAISTNTVYTFWAKLFDEAGNTSSCSSASVSYTLDTVGPTVAVGAPSVATISNGATSAFAVTYTGASTIALTSGGVTVTTASGDAACSSILVTNGTTATPTVTLSSCTGDGTVTVTINAATASDALGNTSTASAASSILTISNSMSVVPRYSSAPNWMDYAKSSNGTACDGTETARSACLHGAEYKTVEAASLTSCTGLSMTDNNGWYNWVCDDADGTVAFNGTLKTTVSLKDVINFDPDGDTIYDELTNVPTFKTNFVTLVNGCGMGCDVTSTPAVWWTNTLAVLPDNAGSSPIKLDGTNNGGNDAVFTTGTILTLHTSRNTAGFVLNMDKIGVVLNTATTLTHTGVAAADATVCNFVATICLSGSTKFNYFSGTLNGSAGTGAYGVYLVASNKFSRFGSLSISAYSTAGLYLTGALYTTFTTISVSGTTVGSGVVSATSAASDIYFGDVTSSSNGNAITHAGVKTTGGSLIFKTITAESNAGHGVEAINAASATYTVTGAMSVNSNGTAGLASGANLDVVTTDIGSISAHNNSDYGVHFLTSVTSGTIGPITVTGSSTSYNKSYGLRIRSSGVTFGAINVSGSGDAAGDSAVSIAGSNTFSTITASNNSAIGINIVSGTNTFGTLVASSNTGSYGIRVNGTNTFNSTVTANNNSGNGVDVNSGVQNFLGNIIATGNTGYGFINGTSNSFFGDILTSGSSSQNISVSGSGNTYGNIYSSNTVAATSVSTGIYLNNASKSRFGYLVISNNSLSRDGIFFNSSSYNRFKGFISNNNARYGIGIDGSYNIFGPSTVANNANYGVSTIGSSNIFLSPVNINNAKGIYISGNTAASTFVNAVSSHNGDYGIIMNSSPNNTLFLGSLIVNGNTTNKCSVGAGAVGLINLNCTDAGTAGSSVYTGSQSSAVLRIPVTLASSYVGKVTTNDSVNSSDTNGSATYDAALNFLNFETIFRHWGKDGSAFPNSDNRARCATGTCRIWDWTLSSVDNSLINRSGNGSFVNGDNNLNGTCDSGELCDVREVLSDSVGDDDGTCEVSEVCYNSFGTAVACPVEVRGSEYVYSAVFTYDANYSAGSNAYEMLDAGNGTCELGESCHESGNFCTTAGMTCMQKFLKNAMEIEDTGGDSDFLCEAGETCLYTPNFGMYQGHGAIGTCTFFANGGLSGITMYGHPYNGR